MRLPSLALAAALALAPSLARAQAAVTFTNVVRTGSPRAPERPSGILTRDEALGVRDCPCESWTFEGTINPASAARTLEWWVGTTATACATATSRFPAANATCWPLDRLGLNRTLPISANRFVVTVPARWLVDPLNGTCTPPPSVSAGSSVHFTGLLRPPDDMVPSGTVAVTISTARPRTVEVASAAAAENSAIVEWQHIRSEDGGTAQVPENTAGYYVLCLPRLANYDAGLSTTGCTSTAVDSGASTDAAADATASDASDMDSASVDSGSAPTTDASTEPTTCASAALPSGFDPNDDAQLARYACSPLLSVGTSRYTVTGLANGSSYRFAVIAQDNAGNRSEPSALTTCVTPESVTDFWEQYERAGGAMAARPGACSVGAIGSSPTPWLLALGALAAASLGRARRKEPRS